MLIDYLVKPCYARLDQIQPNSTLVTALYQLGRLDRRIAELTHLATGSCRLCFSLECTERVHLIAKMPDSNYNELVHFVSYRI